MGDTLNNSDGLKLADQATLDLLSALESEEKITQRSLAVRIGVALGLTNSLLKRCLHKGLIKIVEVPAKRYRYYVTPKGFGEKSRLVAEYLSSALSFFRQAKDEYATVFTLLKKQHVKDIVIYGTGELAEIAILAANEQQINVKYVLGPGSNQQNFCGYQLISSVEKLDENCFGAIILANSKNPQGDFNDLAINFSEKLIYDVPLLHVSRNNLHRSLVEKKDG